MYGPYRTQFHLHESSSSISSNSNTGLGLVGYCLGISAYMCPACRALSKIFCVVCKDHLLVFELSDRGGFYKNMMTDIVWYFFDGRFTWRIEAAIFRLAVLV